MRTLLILIAAVVISGCSDRQPPAREPLAASIDSGGSIPAIAAAPMYSVINSPAIAAAAAEALEFDLTNVSNVVELGGGRLVTYSAVGARLLQFNGAGNGTHVLARSGQGPGQFMAAIGPVRWSGDTVVLVDPANGRISWAVPDKGVVASTRLSPGFPQMVTQVAGVLPGRRTVLTSAGRVQAVEAGKPVRPPALIYLLSHEGSTTQVAEVPDLETVLVEGELAGRPDASSSIVSFGLHASMAVWDSLIVVASSDRYEIDSYDATGNITNRIRLDRQRRPVTGRMRDSVIQRQIDDLDRITEPIADRNGLVRFIRATPAADSLPPIDRLMASPDGILWALDPVAPGDTIWTAIGFNHDGSIHGRLESKVMGKPMLFGTDHVILKHEDADGVVSLVRYPIRLAQ